MVDYLRFGCESECVGHEAVDGRDTLRKISELFPVRSDREQHHVVMEYSRSGTFISTVLKDSLREASKRTIYKKSYFMCGASRMIERIVTIGKRRRIRVYSFRMMTRYR